MLSPRLGTFFRSCHVVAWAALLFTGCGGGGSDPIEPDPVQPVSISYAIEVTASPAEANVRVGESTSATLTWQFSSTAANPSLTNYSVSSDQAGLQINGGTGSSLPNRSIDVGLQYECISIGVIDAELTIQAGTARQNMTWRVHCTGQRIVVTSLEPAIASIRSEAQTQLMWQYVSVGEEPQELPYVLSSDDELLAIEPLQGTSVPEEAITATLTYACQTAGGISTRLTIDVGTATQSVVWAVTCTEESVEVEHDPANKVASVGDEVETVLVWHVESTDDDPREIAYTVSSTANGLLIADAEGSALPNASMTNLLTYRCAEPGTIEIPLTIAVGSAVYEATWIVSCTNETIHLPMFPAGAQASIGSDATAELVWQFSTSGPASREFEYSVIATYGDVRVIGGKGMTPSGTEIVTGFAYSCQMPGLVGIDVAFLVGNARVKAVWSVVCTEEMVTFERIPMNSSVSVGYQASSTFVWQIETSGDQTRWFDYLITSTESTLQINPSVGRALPGSLIETELNYACEAEGEVLVPFTIEVGSASEELSWRIECTQEQIEFVMKPSPRTVISVGLVAQLDLQWQVRSSAALPRSFDFSLVHSIDDTEISREEGTTNSDTIVSRRITYQCNEVGTVTTHILIEAGNALLEQNWTVVCSEESVFIEIPPVAVTAAIGATVQGTVQWRIESTHNDSRIFDYQIRSISDALAVVTKSGQANLDEIVSTDFTFTCQEVGRYLAHFQISVGSADKTLGWEVHCTAGAIEFIEAPSVASVAGVGETASTHIRWQLASEAPSTNTLEYVVELDTSSAVVSNPRGSVTPGEIVAHDLTYSCREVGQFQFDLQVQAGQSRASTTWQVTCTVDSIAIVVAPVSTAVPLGDSVISDMVWELRSASVNREVRYEISSPTPGLQIRHAEGVIASGNSATATLRYVCTSRRTVLIEVQIVAGTAKRSLPWQIDCFGEDLTRIIAQLYQGPKIATVELHASADEWSSALVPPRDTTATMLRLRTNRQAFVELRTEHSEREPLPLAMRLTSENETLNVDLIGTVETRSLASNRYTSRFVFELPARTFSDFLNMEIEIDPESLFPESNERNNLAQFALDADSIVALPQLKLRLIPIRTSHGVPDLLSNERFTRPIYELMPVGTPDVSIGAELDLRDLSWSRETGTRILNELFEVFLSQADRDSFYKGVVVADKEQAETLCGIAFVDSNVSITVDRPDTCSSHTFAHEIGHNFGLNHAPACGAENANVDPNFPYPEGNIGSENGWLMQQRQFINGDAPPEFVQLAYRYYDVMSYCPDTFTSQYSYGKALQNLIERSTAQAGQRPSRPMTFEFEPVSDKSRFVVGSYSFEDGWEVRKMGLIDREPHRFSSLAEDYALRIVHIASGTVLHREWLKTFQTAHDESRQRSWGARIPYFNIDGLQMTIVDSQGREVLAHNLKVGEEAPSP